MTYFIDSPLFNSRSFNSDICAYILHITVDGVNTVNSVKQLWTNFKNKSTICTNHYYVKTIAMQLPVY